MENSCDHGRIVDAKRSHKRNDHDMGESYELAGDYIPFDGKRPSAGGDGIQHFRCLRRGDDHGVVAGGQLVNRPSGFPGPRV